MPPRTRSEELRRQLADDIITGRVAPGQRLDEHELAERFGVSRTPVREALRHLAAIGLAAPGPNRSMYAAAISPDTRTELFEVMAELEGVCARLAAQRMSVAERRQLESLHREAGETMRGGDCQYIEALQIPDADKKIYLENVVGGQVPTNAHDQMIAEHYMQKIRCNYTPMLMKDSTN